MNSNSKLSKSTKSLNATRCDVIQYIFLEVTDMLKDSFWLQLIVFSID